MRKNWRIVRILVAFVLLIACGYSTMMILRARETFSTWYGAPQVTKQAQEYLTEKHRDEVSDAIEQFELVFLGLDAQRNLEVEEQIIAEDFRQYAGRETHWDTLSQSETFLVTSIAEVTDLIVYEYDNSRFKAGACVLVDLNHVQPDGTFVDHVSTGEICRIYVFFKEENTWKLAAQFTTSLVPNSTMKRYWSQRPEWEVEVMGEELPARLPEPRYENE